MLVHGGMAQDVGPILEMVTEKYLLRSEAEWQRPPAGDRHPGRDPRAPARRRRGGRRRGHRTQFRRPDPGHHPVGHEPLHRNADSTRARGIGRRFLGLLDAWRHVRRRHGLHLRPRGEAARSERLEVIMRETKRTLERAVPFAMEPVVYDFAINERGTHADLLSGDAALMPPGYYTLAVPALLRTETRLLPADPPRGARSLRRRLPHGAGTVRHGAEPVRPYAAARHRGSADASRSLAALLDRYGFDREQHEQIQADLRSGRIGLAQNRLPATSRIEDVAPPAWATMSLMQSAMRPAACPRAIAIPACRRWRTGWSPCHAGRRRGQPLDQGRGRGQGAASVFEAGRPPPQLHRSASGEEPAHQPAVRRTTART